MSNPSADRLAETLQERGLSLAVAESLTCGALASTIGAVSEASEWFRGGVVAYINDVKYHVLGVPEGPVVTDTSARQMARGARTLLEADVAIAVTGVGGPGPEEGKPSGTVFIAVDSADGTVSAEHHFDGEPEQVLDATIEAALSLTVEHVAQGGSRATPSVGG